jgi:hypothetical protein
MPQYQQPAPYAPMPGQSPMPGQTPMPGVESPMSPGVTPSPSDMTAPPAQYTGDYAAGGASVSGLTAAYIDDARVWNIVRFRFDAGFDNEFPDRAEFFYPQCGCFGGNAPGPGSPPPDLRSASSVDFQEYQLYVEYALHDRFSLFVDVPFRSVQGDLSQTAINNGFGLQEDASGLSDIQAGFKLALVACPWQYDTIQLRVYTPTGEGDRGLGTEHVSIEPAYLAYRQWSDRLRFNGEFRVWVPLSDTRLDDPNSPFDGELWAGTVLRYGIGVAYDLHQTYDCCCNVTNRCSAVFEAVGWSVLDGLKSSPEAGTLDASGDTIINLKLGGRWTCCYTSLYVGYGHAVTDQAWYRDVIRAELAYLY